MSEIHNALQHWPKLLTGIGSAVGLSHEQDGILRLNESITAIHDPAGRDEYSFLRDEQLWQTLMTQAAVAAQFGFIGLRNPAGSGLICTLSGFEAFAAAIVTFEMLIGPTSSSGVVATQSVFGRDTRDPLFGGGIPILSLAGSTAAINVGNGPSWGASVLSNVPVVESSREWILSPGFDLRIYCNVVNTAVNVSLWGRVRKALKSEGV